jgi:hypothetical protein
MRKSALWLLASLSIATTACVRTHTNEATGSVDVDVESPTKQGEDWKATLKGQGMYTAVSGTARALYSEGRTAITVNLENATPGASYMWDVREGKCGTNGNIVGDHGSYTNLSVGNDGKAGATVTINARLDEAKNYAVTVYSSNDMTNVLACGDLDD